MPWSDGAWTDPWLPVGDQTTVAAQRDNPVPTLTLTRDLIALRRAFADAAYEPVPCEGWAYRRGDHVIALNLEPAAGGDGGGSAARWSSGRTGRATGPVRRASRRLRGGDIEGGPAQRAHSVMSGVPAGRPYRPSSRAVLARGTRRRASSTFST